MKIAIWHNLPSGGGKRALYNLVQGLVERGHRVESWCPSTADQSYLPLGELIPEHVIPFDLKTLQARGPLSSLLAPYREMMASIAAMDEHCGRCAAEINQRQFDVLFANSCALFRVTAIGRRAKIPTTLYLGEPYRSLYEALPRLPWLALPRSADLAWTWSSFKTFAKDLVRVQALRLQAREEVDNAVGFDQILVNSHFSRESILRTYGLDARVTYLGIAADQFRPLDVPRERVVVGVGAIAYHKGVDTAVRAVATIPEDARPALVWVGNMVDEEYRREVEALARSLGVSLVLRVDVSHEELIGEISRAAVMIYTSRLEPFGLAPLEANACETPVVAVSEGGVRETIRDGENGILVPDRRPDQIGAALLRVLDDPGLARRLGSQGREWVVSRWSWKDAIDRVENALYDVSGKQRACREI